jgi:hypothetical protein
MNDETQSQSFICPECGGITPADRMQISPSPTDTTRWSRALSRIVCADCCRILPAWLAERWNGVSIAEARQIWRADFREHGQSGPHRN